MSETVDRLTMAWPKGLKQQVREKNGPRGLTEFVVEAVELHLKGGAGDTIKSQEKEVNELKWLVQLLADRIVMGGSDQDRREALMEVEFPSWVDTNGWPSEWARLVKPEVASQPVVVENRAGAAGAAGEQKSRRDAENFRDLFGPKRLWIGGGNRYPQTLPVEIFESESRVFQRQTHRPGQILSARFTRFAWF